MTEETPNPHPKRKHRVTDAEIMKAIEATRGNLTAAARVLQVDRARLHIRVHKYPHLKAKLLEQREVRIDYAESTIDKAMNEGNVRAALAVLRMLGKDRGYTESVKIEHSFSKMDDSELTKFITEGLGAISGGDSGSEAAGTETDTEDSAADTLGEALPQQ